MSKLKIPLIALDRLKIYQLSKKHIFELMDGEKIPLERVDEIMDYVRDNVVYVETKQEAIDFCEKITDMFEELKIVNSWLLTEEYEEEDHLIAHVIDAIMEDGEFDTAAKAMEIHKKEVSNEEKMKEMKESLPQKYAEELKQYFENV